MEDLGGPPHGDCSYEKLCALLQVFTSDSAHLCENFDAYPAAKRDARFPLLAVSHGKHFEPVPKVATSAFHGVTCGCCGPSKDV